MWCIYGKRAPFMRVPQMFWVRGSCPKLPLWIRHCHTVSGTSFHTVPWSLDTCSTQRSPVHECTASQLETPICACCTTQQFSWQLQYACGSPMDGGGIGNPYKTLHFHSRHWHRTSWNGPPENSLFSPLPHLHWATDVGRFCSCLCKWGMAPSAACECGAEEQTIDHVVLQCPTRLPRPVTRGEKAP